MIWITFRNGTIDTTDCGAGLVNTENTPACVGARMTVLIIKGKAVVKRLHFLDALIVWLSSFSELCVVQFY